MNTTMNPLLKKFNETFDALMKKSHSNTEWSHDVGVVRIHIIDEETILEETFKDGKRILRAIISREGGRGRKAWIASNIDGSSSVRITNNTAEGFLSYEA